MIEGLPIDINGKIKKCLIDYSSLSDILLSSIRNDIRKWQESFCISCWRYSPYDSVAIWNQYASINEGVAIVADLSSIRESFQKFGDIRLALIEYRDLSDETSEPMRNNPLTYKDVRFSSEEEARFYFRAMLGNLKGVAVPVDLLEAVREIHLSPKATNEFKEMIQGMLNNHNFNIPIVKSSLGKVPNKF